MTPPWPGIRLNSASFDAEPALQGGFEEIAALRHRNPPTQPEPPPWQIASGIRSWRRRAARGALPQIDADHESRTRSWTARTAGQSFGPPIRRPPKKTMRVGAPHDREEPEDGDCDPDRDRRMPEDLDGDRNGECPGIGVPLPADISRRPGAARPATASVPSQDGQDRQCPRVREKASHRHEQSPPVAQIARQSPTAIRRVQTRRHQADQHLPFAQDGQSAATSQRSIERSSRRSRSMSPRARPAPS